MNQEELYRVIAGYAVDLRAVLNGGDPFNGSRIFPYPIPGSSVAPERTDLDLAAEWLPALFPGMEAPERQAFVDNIGRILVDGYRAYSDGILPDRAPRPSDDGGVLRYIWTLYDIRRFIDTMAQLCDTWNLKPYTPGAVRDSEEAADTPPQETTEDGDRDITRAQSVALLHGLFMRLGLTQTCSRDLIAQFAEAVTNGKLADNGHNTYSRKHLDDPLSDEMLKLIDNLSPRPR